MAKPYCELSALDGASPQLLAAFDSGIAYHDAVMAMRKTLDHGGVLEVDGESQLERLLTEWHNAIAVVLEVEP